MREPFDKFEEGTTVEDFLTELRGFLRRHHPRDSRIVRAIADGTASRPAVRGFAREIYALSAISLRPFAAMVSNAPDERSFRLALENFASEAGLLGEAPHPALFRRFALATGASAAELDAHVPLPSTLGAMYALERSLRGPFDEAVAGFGLAIEGPASEWGGLVLAGLREHYRFDDDALRFWILHFQEDGDSALEAQHAENARLLLRRFAATAEQQARLGRVYVHSVLLFENLFLGMASFL